MNNCNCANTHSCGCAGPEPVSRRCKCSGTGPVPERKGIVNFCDICDPCNNNVSNVRLCAFVVPTLEDGRYYKNSFIFVQEDDSTYYISDDRSEVPFGSRPKFIDEFNPEDNKFKNTVVYDLVRKAGYVYGPEGTYLAMELKDDASNVKSDTVDNIVTLTQEEFDAIENKDPRTLYLVTGA